MMNCGAKGSEKLVSIENSQNFCCHQIQMMHFLHPLDVLHLRGLGVSLGMILGGGGVN